MKFIQKVHVYSYAQEVPNKKPLHALCRGIRSWISNFYLLLNRLRLQQEQLRKIEQQRIKLL